MARPLPTFNDFIGQEQSVTHLRRIVDGALRLKETLPHGLFMGPSGVGKTKLAMAFAQEFCGSKPRIRNGKIEAPDLAAELVQIKHGEVLIVDEAHNLSPVCQELLYEAIDNLVVPIFGEKETSSGDNSSEKLQPIQQFTVILATDQPGKLLGAMRRRLAGNKISLDYYSEKELTQIIAAICSEYKILISPQAARKMATISRGVPGIAKENVKMLRLYYPDAETTQLSTAKIDSFCVERGIDTDGLEIRDRKYLESLYQGTASLGSLALKLGLDQAEVQLNIEPYLHHLGLFQIGGQGRHLTAKGRIKVEEHRATITQEDVE